MVLGIWSFLLIIVANVVCGNDDESLEIPGCIDLDALPNNLAKLENDQIAKLRCLCSSSKRMDMYGQLGVSIMCIYGSRLEDVRQSMLAVNEANRTIHRISINHMAIDETFNETFIDFPLHELQQFEIRSCHGSPVNLSYLIPTTTSLKSLTEITVEDCQLEEMPSELLKRSYNLKVLNLRKNKIIHIKKYELEEVAKSLEVLDLSGNLLAEMEPDSIGQLKSLNKLIIGEHNSVKNLANDLGKLMEIRTLDLTRIDGLDDLSKINFTQTKKLENLILTGCNIKSINRSHLNGLANLKKLDLRVNLLEAIEEGSFAQMHNLNYLSLAGNFLQESTFGPKLWDGLHSLQFLDIGWNEVTQISSQFFKNLHKSLRALDLSHNEKLSKIDENAFGKMVQLARLNLNGCGLKNITKEMFRGMTHLTELDLSFNKIEFIDSLAFEEQTSHLQQLSLDENRLKYLNITFLENLPNLTEIDISGNPWICDDNGKSIAEWIRNKYRVAAEKNLDFLLKNSEKTVCARPYKLKGQPLLDVEEEDFEENFDESLDTTTLESTSTTTAEDDEQAKKSTLNFENIFVFVGNSSSNETVKDADIGKPKYDINSIRYGTDRPKESSNDWVSLVTVGVLVIATIIGVTLVIKRKKENSKNQSMNETGMM